MSDIPPLEILLTGTKAGKGGFAKKIVCQLCKSPLGGRFFGTKEERPNVVIRGVLGTFYFCDDTCELVWKAWNGDEVDVEPVE